MIKLDERSLIMTIKNRLKELRKSKHLTLDDIAEETNIKRGTFSNWENGKTEPKLESWQKLADYFGVSVPYLQGVSNVNDALFRTVADFVSGEEYRSFDLLDNSVQITINGKDVSASDLEKIREYAMFITKSD